MKFPHSILSRILAAALFTSCAITAIGCDGTTDEPQGPICDPLVSAEGASGASGLEVTNGLKATLYSIRRDLSPNTSVVEAIATGSRFELDVYLSQLFTPLLRFENGFIASNGVPLTNPDGSVFSAWFAMRIEGYLTLGTQQLPGQYQFALFSDDGSLFKINDGSGFRTIVNNDFAHDAILRVSTQPVNMTLGDRLPIMVEYMQGSPDFLSLILLWRPWPTGDERPVNDPAVGVNDPIGFWDYTRTPSAPGPRWNDLLTRGWKVVPAENFFLDSTNPCAPQPTQQ